MGSSYFNITAFSTIPITNYDSVFLATPVSIGGVVLFGLYPCNPDNFSGPTSFDVQALDQLGNPQASNATTSLAVLPQFTTTSGTQTVNVYLPSYPYLLGTTFAVLTPTNVGGITLSGNYVLMTTVDTNNFTIQAASAATFNDSQPLNAGNIAVIFNFGSATPFAPNPFPPQQIAASDWFMDNYGQILVTCPVQAPNANNIPYQPLYQWTPGQINATVIPQAPSYCAGMFIAMPQRQIVAWGTTETGVPDPLLIRWCDVGNFTNWTDVVTNQAGAYRIPTGSKIVAGIQGPQQGIIWTDVDVWAMQYTGPPYVYGFNKIGTGCGLIAPKACGSAGGVIYWMGFNQLFTLDGNGIQILPCSVWDKVFQNLNTAYASKIRIAINSRFNEVWWFYPSAASTGENDSYIKINTELGTWNYGTMPRSAWVDQSVLGPPIAADPVNGYIYQHETSDFADGAILPATFSTGYFAQAEGDYKIFVDWIWPDMKWGQLSEGTPGPASIQISFYVKDYPSDTPQQFGPYTVSQATEYFYTRFRGRLMQVQVSSLNGYFWRLGLIRYRYSIDGKI